MFSFRLLPPLAGRLTSSVKSAFQFECAEHLPEGRVFLEGFKTREIAGMLGIPENTVKTRLRAAREHLRKDLKGACFA